ncbi:MAG: HesA/MoeB/ThiF family protein, partial [Porphyromonadaceae bacterium]|nr:HesA/MoeB/ThiF family protein [Porphyromonadaceae bacterium]
AAEALKLLLGLPSPLSEGLLLVDSLQLSFQLIRR